jgi:hypothetical protein
VFVKTVCSLLLLAIGVAVVYLCARMNTLECTRDPLSELQRSNIISGNITRTGVNYRNKEYIAPGELLRAELDPLYHKGGVPIYRIRLILSSYSTFLTHIYSVSYGSTIANVDRINYFIQPASLRSVSIVQDDRFGGIFIGSIFLLAGISVLII